MQKKKQKKERKQNKGEKDVFTFSSHVTLGWHGSWVTLVVVFQFVKTSQLLAQFIFLIHIFTKTRESSQNNCGCAKSSSSALGYASSAQKKKKQKQLSAEVAAMTGKCQTPHVIHLSSYWGWIAGGSSLWKLQLHQPYNLGPIYSSRYAS